MDIISQLCKRIVTHFGCEPYFVAIVDSEDEGRYYFYPCDKNGFYLYTKKAVCRRDVKYNDDNGDNLYGSVDEELEACYSVNKETGDIIECNRDLAWDWVGSSVDIPGEYKSNRDKLIEDLKSGKTNVKPHNRAGHWIDEIYCKFQNSEEVNKPEIILGIYGMVMGIIDAKYDQEEVNERLDYVSWNNVDDLVGRIMESDIQAILEIEKHTKLLPDRLKEFEEKAKEIMNG